MNIDHVNLFGIDEKYGPVAISIIREVLTKSAVLGRDNEGNEKNNSKKHQYKVIVRTCDVSNLFIKTNKTCSDYKKELFWYYFRIALVSSK